MLFLQGNYHSFIKWLSHEKSRPLSFLNLWAISPSPALLLILADFKRTDREKEYIFFLLAQLLMTLAQDGQTVLHTVGISQLKFQPSSQGTQTEWSSRWPATESQELPPYTHLPLVRKKIQDMSGWAHLKLLLGCWCTENVQKQIWMYWPITHFKGHVSGKDYPLEQNFKK